MQQSQPQDKELLQRFQTAIIISKLDKEHKKKSQVNPNQKHDFHEIEIKQDDKVSKAFVVEDPKHNEVENEVNKLGGNLLHGGDDHNSHLVARDLLPQQLSRKDGILLKKSPHLLQGWQARYCVMEEKVFRYYLPEHRDKPFGTLNFDVVSYVLQPVRNQQGHLVEFILQPKGGQKLFHFKSESHLETQEWFKIVNDHYQTSMGIARDLTGLVQYHRFWRTERIPQKQFAEEANTGDILLFRGNSVNCQFQRAFTRSDYDHVAMILRFGSGSVYLFEATGCYGVGVCSWRDMMDNKWYELFDKIIYRRLEIKRTNEFLETMQKFVNENIGKQYSCSPQKLLKLKSTISDAQKIQNSKEQRTFFCSELVAAAYKACNLLPPQVASTQYWPGQFSTEKQDLKLLQGRLSQEYLIDFSSL